MDEKSLQISIAGYKVQLQQVEQALAASGDSCEELNQLKLDLRELIALTEGSLLSLKKSLLLASLEEKSLRNSQHPVEAPQWNSQHPAAVARVPLPVDKTTTQEVEPSSDTTSFLDESGSCSDDSDSDSARQDVSDSEVEVPSPSVPGDDTAEDTIIGTCCRAPHANDWGGYGYHDAAIIGIEGAAEAETGEAQVRVMFLYPTQRSMVICSYYLDGTCRYTDTGECRQSHGELVSISRLREFKEHNASRPLAVGDKCLARYDDSVWYKGTVVDVHDNDCWEVMFDGYQEEDTRVLEGQHVIPAQDMLTDGEDLEEANPIADSTVSSTAEHTGLHQGDVDDDDTPIYLGGAPQPQYGAGGWEVHTRGVASKLMSKMGYVNGCGLGRDMQGRVEPVPILLLPPGKSLDWIMERKERMGSHDAFDVLKRLQRKESKEMAAATASSTLPLRTDVFDFLNNTFARSKRVRLTDFSNHGTNRHLKVKEISRLELTKKSDRTLNVQLFKTDEEIKNVRSRIVALEQRLTFNEGRDAKTSQKFKAKLLEAQSYLMKLQHSETAMQRHQTERQNRKKLAIF